MARILGAERNTLKVFDRISGTELEIYYREPTTEERAVYSNQTISRKGRKVKVQVGETRQKFGVRIMSGFRDGDFVAPKDGKPVPIASDKDSPNYAENWKDLVLKHASDIIELLAAHVFEGSAEVEDGDGLDDDDLVDEGEDIGGNSTETSMP